MNKKLVKTVNILTVGSVLASYPTLAVKAATEDSTEEIIDYTTEYIGVSLTDKNTLIIKGYMSPSQSYKIIINEEEAYPIEVLEDGTISQTITIDDKIDSTEYTIINDTGDEVMRNNFENVKSKVNKLIPPEFSEIYSTDEIITGYNHNGSKVIIYIDAEFYIEKDVAENSNFSVDINDTLLPDTLIEIYVVDEIGNKSPSVKSEVLSSEIEEDIDEDAGSVDLSEKNDDYIFNDNKQTDGEKETEEIINNEPSMSAFSMRTASIEQPAGKTYHFVQPGETLYSLARVYNTSVDNLVRWNELDKNAQISSGSLLSVDGKNVYDDITKETTTFPTNQSFIDYVAPYAKTVSKEYNLYTSIMVAQALHESNWGRSNLAKLGNNLFGIKGSYNGNSVVMLTWEELPNGDVIWIQDRFRLYPTFYESIVDNAERLRKGTSWAPNYYNGTWVENTASHLDATEWLTGRYATDSQYDTKVNNTIRVHNLQRFDEHINITNPIISQNYINRDVFLKNSSTPIYSQPYGTASYKTIDNTDQHRNKKLVVKQVKNNDLGSWYLLYEGNRKIGFVNETAINEMYYSVTKRSTERYSGILVQPWSINSRPWGTHGAQRVVNNGAYVGSSVNVLEEKVTDRAIYALIEIDGKTIGWVDNSAIEKNTEVIATYNANYGARVTSDVSLYTAPFGTKGSELIQSNKRLKDQFVEVKQLKETINGMYSLIHNKETGDELGWVDNSHLAKVVAKSESNVSYKGAIIDNVKVYSAPWGLEGFKLKGNRPSNPSELLSITKEVQTTENTYVLLNNNQSEIGWVKKEQVDLHPVISSREVIYKAKVTQPWSINSRPWGTTGYKTIESGANYLNKTVDIVAEKVTPRSTFALINVDGNDLGWIDTTGLDKYTVLSSKSTDYAATLTQPWSINTAPWGTENAVLNVSGRSFVGEEVRVIAEQITQKSTYALIEHKGKVLGWIDTTGIEKHRVLNTRNVRYIASITQPWSINTQPWGIDGYKAAVAEGSQVGKTVNVVQEKTTPRSTYLLLEENGKTIGWIDQTGVNKNTSVYEHKSVDYAATITKPWSINTAPWGSTGFKLVVSGRDYLAEDVKVIAEQVTERSTYALIEHKGKVLGWIDTTGIEKHRVLNTRNVRYIASITQPWSINTQPWGIDGYKAAVAEGSQVGKTVNVVQEKTTPRSTYLLLEENGKTIGWIDQTGVTKNTSVYEHKSVDYAATITKPWSINTAPWGSRGFKLVVSGRDYLGEDVKVIAEQVTERSTYALIEHKGKELGWIDTTGLETNN